ncbi:hypothetical protein L1887_23368 [Cichorium endivia]|nr:hypothetical protein L1887_23368 [Cichorium endivia]
MYSGQETKLRNLVPGVVFLRRAAIFLCRLNNHTSLCLPTTKWCIRHRRFPLLNKPNNSSVLFYPSVALHHFLTPKTSNGSSVNISSLSLRDLSLSPTQTAIFTHNDGRSVNLLQSDDTVPMLYQNVTYNILIVIWLMETNPRHPPLIGFHPLLGLVSAGGRIPSPSPPHQFGSATKDPGEVFKQNAINKLMETVHIDVEELRKKREVEMEAMCTAQAVLRQREEEVLKSLREMQYEKEALEQQLQTVLMNTNVLEGWVRENEGKLGGNATNVNGDDAFEPSDSLPK